MLQRKSETMQSETMQRYYTMKNVDALRAFPKKSYNPKELEENLQNLCIYKEEQESKDLVEAYNAIQLRREQLDHNQKSLSTLGNRSPHSGNAKEQVLSAQKGLEKAEKYFQKKINAVVTRKEQALPPEDVEKYKNAKQGKSALRNVGGLAVLAVLLAIFVGPIAAVVAGIAALGYAVYNRKEIGSYVSGGLNPQTAHARDVQARDAQVREPASGATPTYIQKQLRKPAPAVSKQDSKTQGKDEDIHVKVAVELALRNLFENTPTEERLSSQAEANILDELSLIVDEKNASGKVNCTDTSSGLKFELTGLDSNGKISVVVEKNGQSAGVEVDRQEFNTAVQAAERNPASSGSRLPRWSGNASDQQQEVPIYAQAAGDEQVQAFGGQKPSTSAPASK